LWTDSERIPEIWIIRWGGKKLFVQPRLTEVNWGNLKILNLQYYCALTNMRWCSSLTVDACHRELASYPLHSRTMHGCTGQLRPRRTIASVFKQDNLCIGLPSWATSLSHMRFKGWPATCYNILVVDYKMCSKCSGGEFGGWHLAMISRGSCGVTRNRAIGKHIGGNRQNRGSASL
jgi:hypothetical protein